MGDGLCFNISISKRLVRHLLKRRSAWKMGAGQPEFHLKQSYLRRKGEGAVPERRQSHSVLHGIVTFHPTSHHVFVFRRDRDECGFTRSQHHDSGITCPGPGAPQRPCPELRFFSGGVNTTSTGSLRQRQSTHLAPDTWRFRHCALQQRNIWG